MVFYSLVDVMACCPRPILLECGLEGLFAGLGRRQTDISSWFIMATSGAAVGELA